MQPPKRRRSAGGATPKAGITLQQGSRRRGAKATRRTLSPEDAALQLFPGSADADRRFGLGVLLATLERQGDTGECRYARLERFSSRPGQRPRTTLLERADPKQLARLCSGLAHPDRIRIARAILAGANTHQRMSTEVGLKTGPLYHHLRALERAGILVLVSRNRYDLTEIGRLSMPFLTILALCSKELKAPWRAKKLRYTPQDSRRPRSSAPAPRRKRNVP